MPPFLACVLLLAFASAAFAASPATQPAYFSYVLNYDTPVDPALQARLAAADLALRDKYNMTPEQSAVGVLDLRTGRLAMLHPDRIEYAASVPKIGILLAYFQTHPDAATHLDTAVERELGEMIKLSSNEIASKYSHQIGLKEIQRILTEEYHFYDKDHGGGLWVGKHYGKDAERYGDPIADHSHAATVRQLLRFYLLMEQGKLVSPAASKKMREIFATPALAAMDDRFVKGLAGRPVQIIRKAGWWEDWRHDTAVVTGPGRHYMIVAMTHHPKGDDYLVDLAPAVDDVVVDSRQ
jgi:beta-lactamase class A